MLNQVKSIQVGNLVVISAIFRVIDGDGWRVSGVVLDGDKTLWNAFAPNDNTVIDTFREAERYQHAIYHDLRMRAREHITGEIIEHE